MKQSLILFLIIFSDSIYFMYVLHISFFIIYIYKFYYSFQLCARHETLFEFIM